MMRRTPSELRRLATPEFSRILETDPELIRLDGLKYDKMTETRVLLEILGGNYYVGLLPVRSLTAAKWAFLWMLENHYATGGAIRTIDLDVALYVLSVPDLRKVSCGLADLPAAASGYATATGLSPEEVCRGVYSMIRTAFHPLAMLPPSAAADDDEAVLYDGVWVTRVAGIAARESGMPFDRCLHEMSLSCVCCLYVNWLRRESLKPGEIRHRPDVEIEERITQRVGKLADEFLAGIHSSRK